MKCEHCGKNEVSFVYRSNVNGKVEEKRLCAECAEKLGYTRRFGAQNRAFLQNFGAFFDGNALSGENGPFDGNSPDGVIFSGNLPDGVIFSGNLPNGLIFSLPALMGRMLENPFDDFFAEMPALGASPAAEKEDTPAERAEADHFSRLRRQNALKYEMDQAIQREDFERAAQIRDELRAMEQNLNPDEAGAPEYGIKQESPEEG